MFERLLIKIFEMFLSVFIVKQPIFKNITNSDFPIILR